MQEFTFTEVRTSNDRFRRAVKKDGKARIVWKEQKPGGQIVQSMIVIDEELYKKEKEEV